MSHNSKTIPRSNKKLFLLFSITLFFLGCDKKMINIYDPNILKEPITCLNLTIKPASELIQKKMLSLYDFQPNCPFELDIQYKDCITCNSNFNIQTKFTQGMPSSYLNMTIKHKNKPQYSYYIDLSKNVDEDDLAKGFQQIREDLRFK